MPQPSKIQPATRLANALQNCLVNMYLFLIDLRLAIGYLSEAQTGGKWQLAISSWQLATSHGKNRT
jgi:hypothetical protein